MLDRVIPAPSHAARRHSSGCDPAKPADATARVARRFRAHPAGLAPLLAEQPVQKQPGVPRRAVTGKQWPDPSFTSCKDDAQTSSVASIDAPATP